jgi:tetratricopeptide (TPR) repeat protein
MQNILSRIIKISIYVLVFLLPLFWLPFTFEVFEYNKVYLLFFLVSLGLLAWLGKMVIYDRELRFKRSPLDYFVLGFLLVATLSAFFSVDKDSSVFGFYGRFSNGLIGLLSLGMLYFLITNNVTINKEEEVKSQKSNLKITIQNSKLINLFLWSSGLVVLMGYFSVFRVWQMVGDFWPRVMLQRTFNSVAGSLEGLSIFLAVVMVFLVGLLLIGRGSILRWLILVASLGLLVIVDFMMAWVVLLVTLVLFVGLSLWKRVFRENVNRLLIPIFLIIVAAALIPFKPINLGLPQEQVLSQRTSWEVGFKSATENVQTGFLGTGIGTFHYDFAKEKPVEINKSWLWQIRFDRAGTHIAEILGNMGFLGILSYLGLIGMFLLISYFLIVNRSSLPFLMTFLALIVSQFVYYQNITLAFVFWLMLGLAVVSWQKPIEEKVVSFKNFPELSLVLSTVVIVLGIAILAFYYFGVNFYLADANYQKGLQLLGQERVERLERAVGLNPYSPRYRVALSRTYLYEALRELQKPLEERDSRMIENRVAKAIAQAQKATELQPNSVVNRENLGVIYREIMGVAQGAADWGVKSFEAAIVLEPTNPVLYTELGKLYVALGDNQKAKEYFRQAIEKKSDYSEALIQEALILEKEDVLEEAIAKLEGLLRENPFNIEVMFQLGRLYFNSNLVDEAIEQFRRVTILVPDHSNAHYSLGVAYTTKGEKQKAIKEFEKVLQLNPGNQDVIQKLESLKGE